MKGNAGTSLREQEIYYYIKKFFPQALNRHRIANSDQLMEVDIFIPEINLVIEYDGFHWHQNKVSIDNRKTSSLNVLGYTVLRVREYGLPPLNSFNGDVIEISGDNTYDHINLTLRYLAKYLDAPQKVQLETFEASETYDNELKFIYAARYSDKVEPNLSDMCGIEYWDNEINFPLNIMHVKQLDWVPAKLICENGRQISLPRYRREYRTACRLQNCSCDRCCYGILCPLLKYCSKNNGEKITCPYVEKKVWAMINKGESLRGYDAFYTFKRWLISESDIGEKIVKKYYSYKPNSKKRENIAWFLGVDKSVYREINKEHEFDIYSCF